MSPTMTDRLTSGRGGEEEDGAGAEGRAVTKQAKNGETGGTDSTTAPRLLILMALVRREDKSVQHEESCTRLWLLRLIAEQDLRH